ncbi:hypothetical protein LOAG_10043 [Loa loa]|uniref:Uncharacterized protein n=1 Tax=Loa loa TaxID=7209 RepID=A0A1S0TR73_LOALO|nr:hypothetical protein LOAG_10043 [Loa loa]EFO18449.1 hypothetical protein LOAG_10043 [Loa loa]
MFRWSLRYSRVIESENVRILPDCRLVTTTSSTYEVRRNTTSSMRDPVNDGTKYVRFATILITAIIGLRLVNSIFDGQSYRSFGDTFKSHAFSWPQHYNIFLPQDRLDVNDEDDEI